MTANTRRLWRIMRLGVVLSRHQLFGNSRQFSQVFFDAMLELGGVYIKFLQALLIRSDLFADQTMMHQVRVYENVTPEPIDIEATLRAELGPGWREHIASVNTESFAAGSFGQVYRARLRGGQDVIIKVLRPSLVKNLKFDLRLLGFVARALGAIRPDSMMNMVEIYRDFRDVTASEINYRREAAFALELHERYTGHPSIVIPYTYVTFSTSNIIVQDYIAGISIAEVFQRSANPSQFVCDELGSDLDHQLQEIGFEFLTGVFKYSTTLGDPHPGNIKLLPNNQVGLIDFGMVAEAPKDRASLFGLVKEYEKIYCGTIDVKGFSLALLGMFSGKLVSSIETFGEATRSTHRSRSLLGEMAMSAEGIFASRRGAELENLLGRGYFMRAFNEVINEGNRFGLKVHFDATTFLRSSSMYINLVSTLGCRDTVLRNVYSRVVEDLQTNHPETLTSKQNKISQQQATEVLSDWLDRVAKTDPILFHRLQSHVRSAHYV